MRFRAPHAGEEHALAELRAEAMKPSLVALGRFDEVRVRARLVDGYRADQTQVVEIDGEVVGFFVVEEGETLTLRHLYVKPMVQGRGVGSAVVRHVKARAGGRPVRLQALRGSPSNAFYHAHGFVLVAEEEWGLHYEYQERS